MEKPVAHIFPAFVPEYGGYEVDLLERNGIDFRAMLETASSLTCSALDTFDIKSNNFLGNELWSQYISYLMACAVSDILHKKQNLPAMTAGYSMGLYAALYHTRSVTFAEGLDIITKAYECIHRVSNEHSFGMAVIGGLEEHDITKIIAGNNLNCQLTNINSKVSFVISGIKHDTETAVLKAKEEGALQTRIMNVAHPYHSTYVTAASDELRYHLENIHFRKPLYPLISLIDRKVITSPEQIAPEVARNISSSINWLKTLHHMIKNGIHEYIECGGGESMQKICKFIDGDFRIIGMKKFLS